MCSKDKASTLSEQIISEGVTEWSGGGIQKKFATAALRKFLSVVTRAHFSRPRSYFFVFLLNHSLWKNAPQLDLVNRCRGNNLFIAVQWHILLSSASSSSRLLVNNPFLYLFLYLLIIDYQLFYILLYFTFSLYPLFLILTIILLGILSSFIFFSLYIIKEFSIFIQKCNCNYYNFSFIHNNF